MRTRSLFLTAVTAAAVALSLTGSPASAATAGRWVAGWQASPTAAGAISGDFNCPSPGGVKNQTVRDVLAPSVGGDQLRIQISNTFGTRALHVGSATIARQGRGAEIVTSSLRRLKFNGSYTVTVPPGAQALSDPVALSTRALQPLALSIYLPRATGPATQHFFTQQDSFVSTAGDFSRNTSGAAFTTKISCWLFASGVDVHAPTRVTGTVVTLGDSITDGAVSSNNTNHRYPDYLARRLNAVSGNTLSVSNAGISGDEVLVAREPRLFGPGALARLDRDVLTQTKARTVIYLEGTNDLGADSATAASLIAADKQIIAQVHARGLRIIGATLTPFGGSHPNFGGDYGTAAGERQRQALNRWIRTSGAFDAVADFDLAVRDPARPSFMRRDYDSGDHLHPGDNGYAAMARAVPLTRLLQLSGAR